MVPRWTPRLMTVADNPRMTSLLTMVTLTFAFAKASLPNDYVVRKTAPVSSFWNNTSDNVNQVNRPTVHQDLCKMSVDNRSIAYFQSRVELEDLHLIHFDIRFNNSKRYNSTPETFRPNNWVWTYWSPDGLYPFLYWNIDYGVLSFGLLKAKTLRQYMYMKFNVSDDCNITFGTPETTQSIANALRDATYQWRKSDAIVDMKYEDSYFCYLAEAPNARENVFYQVAIYFMYPISYINYNCCIVEFSYKLNNVTTFCMDKQIGKWPQCTLGPYIIGIIVVLFYPILHFQLFSWIASDEKVESATLNPTLQGIIQAIPENEEAEADEVDDDWLYLDGKSPYKLTDSLIYIWCGLNKTWPVAVSRIRRLVLLILTPLGVYVQLVFYHFTFEDSIKLLVKHRTPMGFLSLLGDKNDRVHSFATIFGGPEVILILYFLLGLSFTVFPRSVKQIYEDAIRPSTLCFKSPLGLSLVDIKRLTMVRQPIEPGYQNVISLLKCGIYILFSKKFWKLVLTTQIERISHSSSKIMYVCKLIIMPLYVIFCIVEIALCIILYGFPSCMCIVLTLRGATRSLIEFRKYLMQFCQSSLLRKLFLENYLVNTLAFLCATLAVIMYAYIVCLIFIETFAFLSQVIVFCFVAVIVYPSVAFGYLFFFVVLMYYIFRRIRDFGDGYLELLSDAVDISRNLDGQPNIITFHGDNMLISNVKVPRGIKSLQINTTTIEIAANVFNDVDNRQKIKLVKNVYGIPRDLFRFLVSRHRPALQQVLKIVFHIMLIMVLIGLTISITTKYLSGPSSGISEVMHVVFIVVVGALPRVLEVALMNGSENVKKDIELRNIEQSVLEYWEGSVGGEK